MRITPLDARKQEFSKSMRGFDCDEVRAFLNTLADEYETVLVDNKQIRERVLEQEDKIADYLNMEGTLRDTLMTAERVMQETRETANREGAVIIQEAQVKAKSILEECRLRTEELRREIMGLRKEKETYLARFRGLAEAQIKFVDAHEHDFEDLDRRLVDIVDAVVTSAGISSRSVRVDKVDPLKVPSIAGSLDAGPEVAPAPAAAPAAGETDIWRDYSPGAEAEAPGGSDGPATVSPSAEEETANNISDVVSESLAETDEGPDEDFRPPVEPLNIDDSADEYDQPVKTPATD